MSSVGQPSNLSMDSFVTVKKPASLKASAGLKGASRFKPYDKKRPSSSAITKHLLSTLSDEKNPITHSTAGDRAVYVASTATGHERAEEKTNRGLYLKTRTNKLARQTVDVDSSQKRVLENVRVYINGFLRDTTDIEMKRDVTLAGGVILHSASGATHILTSQGLSGSKTQKHLTSKSKNIVHVVKPEWVTESIKAGKRLSERNYAVIKDNTTHSLVDMFSKTR